MGKKIPFKSIKAVAKKVGGVFTIFLIWQRKPTSIRAEADAKRKNGRVTEIASSEDDSSKSSSRNKFTSSPESLKALDAKKIRRIDFSFAEIYKGTRNFSAASKIGEGGFGTVYKAKLKDGSFVAVKRVKKDLHDKCLSTEFKNEILTLSKIEQLNLVKFLGFLAQRDEQLILVQYVGNGTLREHLDGICGKGLEIAERLDIAIDIAHAVTYLHMYTDPPIIHRDIKASNILITDKLRAKVADFGVARFAAEDPLATHISTEVKGTTGYLDPEYLMTHQLTEKSDVYSFGVLLVELLTGRQPIELNRSLNERVTVKWRYPIKRNMESRFECICGKGLEIAERLDIAIDIAHAVTYLHMYTDPPIIHRDIKASNILITDKLRAKVADFGVARFAAEDPLATHISTEVKGTTGYLDPEYLMTHQLTEKSDVYSFGVLLVELLTGRQPIELNRSLNERVTVKWALKKLKAGDAIMVMDPRLRRSPASLLVVEKVLKLARQCLAPSRQSRPTMKKCAEVLWSIRKKYCERCLAAASTCTNSANVVERDARKTRHNYFGIEDSESFRFRSA